ncbi:hypothetical protein ALQ39_200020 [Pseudomonas amygdali pv. eriobotryae]|uniref:Uncharacterized protein n=1 Tax=Pseudomonas amygdali pv. eriobotryae TaxID=129137 RepID=A0A3M3X877_PSEA0|nr:hypothetical protein ALQ39_200020 [Pseudomonas amygdali pv. eriobotryae]
MFRWSDVSCNAPLASRRPFSRLSNWLTVEVRLPRLEISALRLSTLAALSSRSPLALISPSWLSSCPEIRADKPLLLDSFPCWLLSSEAAVMVIVPLLLISPL